MMEIPMLNLTKKCPFECVDCPIGASADYQAEMTGKEWIEVIKRLVAETMTTEIQLGGGEPLLHPDIFEILDWCWRKGVKVYLYTNGVLMDDEDGDFYGLPRGLISVFKKYADIFHPRFGHLTRDKFELVFKLCNIELSTMGRVAEMLFDAVETAYDWGGLYCSLFYPWPCPDDGGPGDGQTVVYLEKMGRFSVIDGYHEDNFPRIKYLERIEGIPPFYAFYSSILVETDGTVNVMNDRLQRVYDPIGKIDEVDFEGGFDD